MEPVFGVCNKIIKYPFSSLHSFSDFYFYTFQALNTLGATKWRVNRKVLGVIDRIWASGGRLADLVDRDDVSFFFYKY